MKQQHWTATSADAPSHQHSSKCCLADTLGDSLKRLGSEAKSWCAFARALLLYPRCRAGCAWRNTHANCHWLVLLTLEGDWALGRDPISQSHWRYVERDWLIGNHITSYNCLSTRSMRPASACAREDVTMTCLFLLAEEKQDIMKISGKRYVRNETYQMCLSRLLSYIW